MYHCSKVYMNRKFYTTQNIVHKIDNIIYESYLWYFIFETLSTWCMNIKMCIQLPFTTFLTIFFCNSNNILMYYIFYSQTLTAFVSIHLGSILFIFTVYVLKCMMYNMMSWKFKFQHVSYLFIWKREDEKKCIMLKIMFFVYIILINLM